MSEPIGLSKAADYARRSTAALRRAAAKGMLKATKVGPRSWVTTRQAVQDWLDNPEFHKTAHKKYQKLGG